MPGLLGVGVKEKMAPFHMTSWSCDLTTVSLSLFLKIYLFSFLAVEGLCCHSGLSLALTSRGYCLVAVRGFSCCGAQASRHVGWVAAAWALGSWLSGCSTRA